MQGKYIEGYLVGIRGLSHGSVANAITAAIDVHQYLEFLDSESPGGPVKNSMSVARLKSRRNREQTTAERERQCSAQASGATLLWEQVLPAR